MILAVRMFRAEGIQVGLRRSARLDKWKKMAIEDTRFGSITIDGKTYECDVIVRLSGKVEKRKKKLSKEQYGTSNIISKDEAKFIFEDGCNLLIVAAG